MPPLQYLPLAVSDSDSDCHEFRFLALHPGSSDDPLAGTMLHSAIGPNKDVLDFEALSYCWGIQTPLETITLTNEPRAKEETEAGHINIGPNLASALRALRHPSDKRVLWCDSICINQNDISERSAQVENMLWIYRISKSVIIWLGPETTWSIMAMETVHWAGIQLLVSISDSGFVSYELKPDADHRLVTDKYVPLSEVQWRAMEQLLDLDWNKRLWTFQEARLAKQEACIVKLGDQELPWVEFRNAILLLFGYKPHHTSAILDRAALGDNVARFVQRSVVPYAALDSLDDDWIALISQVSSFQCTDSRDRVYAVRGLVAPTATKHVKTDYTMSTKEIFELVCLNHINQKQNLDFLRMCNGASCSSWVPDLEMPLNKLFIQSNAAGRSACSAHLLEPGVLEAAGIICDELDFDPISIIPEGPFFERIESIVNVFQNLANTNLLNDDEYLDRLIMMLNYGVVRDSSTFRFERPAGVGAYFLQEWRSRIRQWLSGILTYGDDAESQRDMDAYFLMSICEGSLTGCSRTCGGGLVRVPIASRRGDKIACFLGSKSPITLRPQPKPNTYQVIGSAYHPGFSKVEAFLGNDFRGWQPLWDEKLRCLAFYKEGQSLRYSDPRLEGVPLEGGYEEAYTEDERPYWTHPSMKGDIQNDPRLSEEVLKKRGVPIQRLHLV
ncbi:hypothetical protein FAUST_9606 [Fusarium austroamericanum]|uniref:Heterokaryon incompatibility domain-containing protein n=1 Tax=Fusarium austroamericanum TaxID=282268 RepID=A0AAN5Z397_FUSAU|nr:hypothetical protein FAUST_9606 [Fusarium austroamericanum]